MSSDLEGEDMLILEKFGKRTATASLAGRRARETRPLAPRTGAGSRTAAPRAVR